MRLLIDSHTLIWAVDIPSRLSSTATTLLQNSANQLEISAATIWEISIKAGIGKLNLSQPFRPWIEKAISDLSLRVLPITVEYADAQSHLPYHHGDPFDRMMIAQSLTDALPFVSADSQFDAYGVNRIW